MFLNEAQVEASSGAAPATPALASGTGAAAPPSPACKWSAAMPNTYLAGCCSDNCANFDTLAQAQAACAADSDCGGVTIESGGGAW
jgi:hypothetical protein